MYVLCCPCLLHPELRANGITSESDLRLFTSARERCKKFSVDIVPLPCPETLYLGPDRTPGTFLERLDTREFARLMDTLQGQVLDSVEQRGPPLCILGVNSSPTCGVTSTYYGSVAGKPVKREGRGVFLSRFPQFHAMDVTTFSRYHIYLAAPLFSDAERSYNTRLANLLHTHLFDVYLPQEAGRDSGTRNRSDQAEIFAKNREALENADIVVAVVDGADVDSGTAWEMGYAHARGIPVVAIRTDFRRTGVDEQVNLMLAFTSTLVTTTARLLEALKSPVIGKSDT